MRRPFGLPPLDEESRAKALAAPGATWKEYFFFEFIRWWILLGLLIVDSMLIVFWIEVPSVVALVLTLVGALYLELLLYRYLWYRPDPSEWRPGRRFQRSWFRPVAFGRWTPEMWRIKSGERPYVDGAGPDPSEFL